MFADFNITSANASAVLTVKELFPAGIDLQMFGADSAINLDSADITETRMGVDGKMVAGYTPVIFPLTITLEAASPSFASLSQVWTAMRTNKTIYDCTLVAIVPSLKKAFTWSTGVLKSGVPFPGLQKVLAPTTWVFHFQNLDPSNM
jgi:hypothetical protein